MSDEKPADKPARKNYLKVVFGSFLGLCTGGVMMYANALFDSVVKPPKPLANFSVGSTDGLTVTLQNVASGQSGWWDFGDGTALEPFDADKPQVPHTYAKPGSYKVALTVRNFLNEENDRNVSVDVSAPTAGTPADLPPIVKGWKVEAVSTGTQVPATFHVTGELQNADEVIWRLGGDKTEQLTAQSGPIDKYICIAEPGEQHIVLTAFSKSKKEPQVLVKTVHLEAAAGPVYDATLTVTDAANKVERAAVAQFVSVAVHDKAGAVTKSFSRVVTASPGATIVGVELAKAVKTVRKEGVKIEVAADKRSVTVSGEWAVAGDALVREAGGSSVVLPLTVTEERVTKLSPRVSRIGNKFDARQQIVLTIPARLPGTSRTLAVDFGLIRDGKRTSITGGVLDPSGAWASKVKLGTEQYTVQATTVGGQVVVTLQP